MDNLVITRLSLDAIKGLKTALLAAFLVKDLGKIEMCLGLYVVYNKDAKTMTIDQSQYIENMLKAYRMENCTPISTLINRYDSTSLATPNEPRANAQLYQQVVGSLQYASVGTRMDITYAIGRLS
jgi:hypothetical protein